MSTFYNNYNSLFLELVNQIKHNNLLRIKQLVIKFKEQFLEWVDLELIELSYDLSISAMIKKSVKNFIKGNSLKIKDVLFIILEDADELIDLTNSAINELEDLIFRKAAKLIYQEMQLAN